MIKIKKHNQSGYTLIEMTIVIFIIVTLSTILFTNYNGISRKGEVLRHSERLKNELRLAQNYSLNHKSLDSFTYGWGVKIDRPDNSYTVFADKDNDKKYSFPIKLLIHGDEGVSSSAFTESSVAARTVAVIGNADQINDPGRPDTAEDGYWEFDGALDYLSLDDSIDFDLLDQDFVLDWWFWSDPNNTGMRGLLYKWGNSSLLQSFNCHKDPVNDIICRLVDDNDLAYEVKTSQPGGLSASQWYHVALTRKNDIVKLFLDGNQVDLIELPANTIIKNSTAPVIIGAYDDGTNGWWGRLDEIRLGKGLFYWDTNFSLPTKNHAADTEGLRTIVLPPEVYFYNLAQQATYVDSLDIFFSPLDWKMYINYDKGNPSNGEETAIINLREQGSDNLTKILEVQPSGVVDSISL